MDRKRGTVAGMFADQILPSQHPVESVLTGTVLARRGERASTVVYIESGRAVLGVLGEDGIGGMEHQLGVIEGPSWLEATTAVLNAPSVVDVMAQTPIRLRRMPLQDFQDSLSSCAPGVQSMLRDVSRAYHQQTQLAVSRLAKDAESRCAEWLLSHAEASEQGGCSVHLEQRKRAIAAQLGIAPETLSRVLRHMRELSLISGSGREVKLVDPAGLRHMAGVSAPCRCGLA